jgi:hypothetical protein
VAGEAAHGQGEVVTRTVLEVNDVGAPLACPDRGRWSGWSCCLDVACGPGRSLAAGRKAPHADYLLAADGTHSPIRRQLCIGTSGFGQLPIFVVFIYFRAQWRQFVPDLGDGDAVQIDNPEVTGIFV